MPQTVRVVATAEHQYAGHRLQAGEEYDCEEQHVSHFQRLGWAKPVERSDESQQTYLTRALTAGKGSRRGRAK